MQLGFIGLGKMGSRMVSKLLKEGHDVVVWNRSQEASKNLESRIQNSELNSKLKIAKTIEELVQSLEKPRVIWLMVSAGEATESVLDEVTKHVAPEDIIIDGGNAHFKDTQKRYEKMQEKNIRFLGIGVSGGLIAAEDGYPLMVGGERSAYEEIKPLLESLSKPLGGYEYLGEGGAGHFVKMVHNAIEYGYMQAIGEGFGVLEKSAYGFDLEQIAKLYQKNSLVSGFMMDRTVDALKSDPGLENITGVIAESGEAKWTVLEAQESNLPVPVIKESLRFRTLSQVDEAVQNSFAAKMVAALRNAFGGHKVEKKN